MKASGKSEVLTIGNFDGVHLGHRALIGEALALGAELGTETRALTFRPHPISVLRPESAPPLLTTYDEKLTLLREVGVSVTEMPFTPSLASTSAEEFVERAIFGTFAPKGIVVGHDFAFGRDRRGGFETLSHACLKRGTVLKQAKPYAIPLGGANQVVSSSVIRGFLAQGDVRSANALLGREFGYAGVVAAGQGRGKGIGFPTANLPPTPGKALLPLGVYATRAWLATGEEIRAVTNVGVRPTLGENLPVVIETHLIDFARDLYGEAIEVRFVDRIRGERKFAGVAELREQIAKDRQRAVEILAPS